MSGIARAGCFIHAAIAGSNANNFCFTKKRHYVIESFW
jgi:hypothetical protein